MARETISFSEEECGAGGRVARRRALDRGSGKETKKCDEFAHLSFGELESGHARGRNPFSNQFAQLIHCASASIFGGDNIRPSLTSPAIRAVAGGASRFEMTPPRVRRL